MKEGRKSAVKLHDNERDAAEQVRDSGKGYSVVKRPGEAVRCASYCSVAHGCPHFSGEVIF